MESLERIFVFVVDIYNLKLLNHFGQVINDTNCKQHDMTLSCHHSQSHLVVSTYQFIHHCHVDWDEFVIRVID